MIKVHIPDLELFDEETLTFIDYRGGDLKFEHSLKAVMQWEAIYEKPFLTTIADEMTDDELVTYFNCMCLEDAELHPKQFTKVVATTLTDYINYPHTATKISNPPGGHNRGAAITAEVIYAMMANANIPFSCEDWNLNNLMMVIAVIAIQHGDKTKMSRAEIYKQNTALNEQRRKTLNSRG